MLGSGGNEPVWHGTDLLDDERRAHHHQLDHPTQMPWLVRGWDQSAERARGSVQQVAHVHAEGGASAMETSSDWGSEGRRESEVVRT